MAQLYDIRMADLVPEPRGADPLVVRADERPGIHYSAEGIDIEILVPPGPTGLSSLLATFGPRAAMEDFVLQSNQQFLHVIDGHFRTEFGDGRTIELGPGDSATFTSSEGHRHANLCDAVARMIIVIRRPDSR